MTDGNNCLIDEMTFATFHVARCSAGVDTSMSFAQLNREKLNQTLLNSKPEETKESSQSSHYLHKQSTSINMN